MSDEQEPLSSEIKIRVTRSMREQVQLAIRDWPRTAGERRISESEWLRIAITRLIAAGK